MASAARIAGGGGSGVTCYPTLDKHLIVAPPPEVIEAVRVLEVERELLRRAERRHRNAIKMIAEAALTADATDEQLVEMYWSLPDVRPDDLARCLGYGSAGQAFANGAWGQRVVSTCLTCDGPIVVASRAAMAKFLQDTGPLSSTCNTCRRLERERQYQGSSEARMAHRMAVVAQLRAMPYSEYLQTEHWSLVRMAALRRAKWRCQLCGNNGSLDVHHNTYERRGCEEASDIIALCRPCHSKHHGKAS